MEREESDLYGLPLDEFVPARTALERRLRKEGERERATAVKKLPKPSVAAWAVNQASRSQPKARRELIEASAGLGDVQERLLAGDASARDLEQAAARQRAAIDALMDAAGGLLTSDGKALGEATLARVRETLAAVAADDEVAELVEAGTLDRERRPAGLGFGFGDPAAAGEAEDGPAVPPGEGRAKGKRSGGRASGGKAAKETARARKEREKAEKRRAKELRAARERVKGARSEEREAEKRRKAAERDARKAAERLEKAERAAEEARSAAEAARTELEAATATASEASSALEAAETEVEALDG